MKKRILRIFLACVLIATTAISTVGCGKVKENEAISLVKDLVSRSYELNVIYYGEGLSYKDSGNPNDIYMPVNENEKYVLRSALIKETYNVFSETYALSLVNMSFNGVASEINQNAIQSRYMVRGDDDWLYVNKNYESVVDEVAEYNYDTIEITKISKRFIEATIKTTKGSSVDVVLIKEDGEWRLDSVTC